MHDIRFLTFDIETEQQDIQNECNYIATNESDNHSGLYRNIRFLRNTTYDSYNDAYEALECRAGDWYDQLAVPYKDMDSLKPTKTEEQLRQKNGCNLQDVDLSYADLRHTTLTGANASSINLSYADCSTADFSCTNFNGANFGSANLQCVDFSGSDLREANLQKSDLTNAFFDETNIMFANFIGANLDRTDFSTAKLNEKTLFKH